MKCNCTSAALLIITFALPVTAIHAKEKTNTSGVVSSQITQQMSVAYMAGESEGILDAKKEARKKLLQKAIALLPTYIFSSKEIDNNEYTERLQFLAASTVKISNEQYTITPIDKQLQIKLIANVTIDKNEINRIIEQLNNNKSKTNEIDIIHEQQQSLLKQIRAIKNSYQNYHSNDANHAISTTRQIIEQQNAYISELINLPMNDMIAEFELKEKRKKVDLALKKIEARNAEYASMTDSQILEMKMNADFQQLYDDSFEQQLKQGFTLKVSGTTADKVVLQIVPLNTPKDQEPKFLPWHEFNAGGLAEFKNKYLAGPFLNSGCYPPNKPNVFQPKYSLPIMQFGGNDGYSVPELKSQILVNENTKWHKEGFVKSKNIYSFSVTVGKDVLKLPFIALESLGNNTGALAYRKHWKSVYDTNEVAKFEHIRPYRTRAPVCASNIVVTFPKLTLSRNKLNDIVDAKITVIKASI